LNFDERNAAWGGSIRYFRQVQSRTAIREWSVWVEKNTIFYSWGQVGGAMQTASEVSMGVNLGKKNEMSPVAYALDRAKEMARKKNWEGYREIDPSGEFLDPMVSTDIDFNALQLGLSFYKPDNSMGAGISKKADKGEVWYSRKRNGLAFIISRGTGRPQLYSRRMLRQHDDEAGTPYTWDDRFPHIVASAENVMPYNSILLGELVMNRGEKGEDDFKHIQSLTKSLTPQSLADQQAKGFPSFYVWDVAFWEGRDLVSKVPVSVRYELIHTVLQGQLTSLIPVSFWKGGEGITPQTMLDLAKRELWEGFVVVDPNGIYGDRAFNFKGKPDRPGAFCAKLKPEFEDDFVAFWDPSKGWGEVSNKGRYSGGVKSVALFQHNTKGELVFISNVNSGLTEEMKTNLSNPALYPKVWKVKYSERSYLSQGDDTNALIFASFVEERIDKTPSECVNDLL